MTSVPVFSCLATQGSKNLQLPWKCNCSPTRHGFSNENNSFLLWNFYWMTRMTEKHPFTFLCPILTGLSANCIHTHTNDTTITCHKKCLTKATVICRMEAKKAVLTGRANWEVSNVKIGGCERKLFPCQTVANILLVPDIDQTFSTLVVDITCSTC